jgi:hypothetical protein
MIVGQLLEFLARSTPAMAETWAKEIVSSGYAATYSRLSGSDRIRRSREVYENLLRWLERDSSQQEIGRNFAMVGKERYREEMPLCEVQFALYLTKKILWNHILSEGLLTSSLEIYQVMDLILRVQNFFDLAAFYIIRGYMEELHRKLGQSGDIAPEKLKRHFPAGSFLAEFNPDRM